jgi:ankyrin repeat protein
VPRIANILKTDPKAGERKDARGLPALHQAVAMDQREIVKMFLEKGCNPEVRSTDDSGGHTTALTDAAFWGRLEIAELLLKHGAKVNAADEKGVTALHEAARLGQLRVAELLLKHGANVHAKDHEGKAPVDWVDYFSKSAEFIKLLRDREAEKRP